MGDPRLSVVDREGSFGALAGGAVEAVGSPVRLLVQIRVPSGSGARWSPAVAGLLLWQRRIGGSAPCFDPSPDPVLRSPCWRRIRWRRCRGAAVWGSGVQAEDLATSGGGGAVLAPGPVRMEFGVCGPGRRAFIDSGSSSAELVLAAALRRLRARSSAAPRCRFPSCRVLRRWWSSCWLGSLVAVDGKSRQCCLCFLPLFPRVFGLVFVLFL